MSAQSATPDRLNRLEALMEQVLRSQVRTDQVLQNLALSRERTDRRFDGLARSQDQTDHLIQRLVQSQERVDQGFEELTQSQARTDLALQEMVQAQARADLRFEELTARTDQRFEELTQAQARVERSMEKLSRTVQTLARQVGGLSETVGGDIEDIGYMVLYDLLPQAYGWEVGELARRWVKWGEQIQEVDLLGPATDPAHPERRIWIVGEAKHNLTLKDVNRFAAVLKRARQHLAGEIFPVCFCYRARPEVEARVKAVGCYLVFSYGKLIPPKGLAYHRQTSTTPLPPPDLR